MTDRGKQAEGDALEVFVLMPYGANGEYSGGVDESNFVFEEIICAGVNEATKDLEVAARIQREVDRNRAGSITRSLVNSLVKADIVVVDLTGRNPNVFFELGIRYGLRDKITILIAHEDTEVPFDIRGYRYIPYNAFRPTEVREQLAEFIREALTDRIYSDSLVFETFPTLTVNIPGVFESRGQNARERSSIMPWSEYLDRIAYHRSYLRAAIDDNRFVPDAIVGITNGGMVAADLLAKSTVTPSSIPTVTLWARRYEYSSSANAYFDNEFNSRLAGVIQEQHPEGAKLVLVDDHLGTGLTSQQAIDFLESRLESPTIVFIPIVSRRIKIVKELVGRHFPSSFDEFRVTEAEFVEQVSTNYTYLPYLMKEINQSSSGSS
jgi:hypoxanthine phosphoribosyltransferase